MTGLGESVIFKSFQTYWQIVFGKCVSKLLAAANRHYFSTSSSTLLQHYYYFFWPGSKLIVSWVTRLFLVWVSSSLALYHLAHLPPLPPPSVYINCVALSHLLVFFSHVTSFLCHSVIIPLRVRPHFQRLVY